MYWAGPMAGAILAGLLYELVLAADSSAAKARKFLQATGVGESQDVVVDVSGKSRRECLELMDKSEEMV